MRTSITKAGIPLVLAAIFSISGCANFESISRHTHLPGTTKTEAKAIHLDAKQRLVLARSGGIEGRDVAACAEPSPDAISAIAASAGIGASVPSQGAASAAAALQTTAASIGLRTQSITLMRDALYRVCEAYYSGQLSRPQVMLLLARSQDLTATVVAIEQLTGAVVAQQAGLEGSANSQAIATLLANKQALEQIDAQLARNQKAYNDAVKAQETAKTAFDVADKAYTDAQKEADDAAADSPDKKSLEETARIKKGDRDRAESTLKLKDADVTLTKQHLDETQKLRDAIARQLDSATTSASAGTTGTVRFGSNQTRDNLTNEAAVAISAAVENIVSRVVAKNYLTDACVASLTGDSPKISNEFARTCYQMMREASQTQAKALASISDFGRTIAGIEFQNKLLDLVSELSDSAALTLATNPPVKLSKGLQSDIRQLDSSEKRRTDPKVARYILGYLVREPHMDESTSNIWRYTLEYHLDKR